MKSAVSIPSYGERLKRGWHSPVRWNEEGTKDEANDGNKSEEERIDRFVQKSAARDARDREVPAADRRLSPPVTTHKKRARREARRPLDRRRAIRFARFADVRRDVPAMHRAERHRRAVRKKFAPIIRGTSCQYLVETAFFSVQAHAGASRQPTPCGLRHPVDSSALCRAGQRFNARRR